MKTSRSAGYGLVAICYIAKNETKGSLVNSNEISEKHGIPLEYLLKILQQLVRGNILKSKRGPRGGFSLSKPVNKISVAEVMESIDGPTNIDLGLSDLKQVGKSGELMDKLFNNAGAAYTSVLSGAMVSSLIVAPSPKAKAKSKKVTKK